MDKEATEKREMAPVETGADTLRGIAKEGSGLRLGSNNSRAETQPLESKPDESNEPGNAKRLLQESRTTRISDSTECVTSRTAVYGPVRTVV